MNPQQTNSALREKRVSVESENGVSGSTTQPGDKISILVADDEKMMLQLLSMSLQRLGYHVVTAENGLEAIELFDRNHFDLVLLDVLMPGMDGFSACAEIRKRSDIPVVMLTALSRPDDIVRGLEIGADNYIVKPFTFKEVEAKLRAILRRTNYQNNQYVFQIIERGDIRLNSEIHQVTVSGVPVELTGTEFQLLHFLMTHADQTVSKEELLEAVWGYDSTDGSNLVEVAISRLRKKIEKDPARPDRLLTVRGIGYRFASTKPLKPETTIAGHKGQAQATTPAYRPSVSVNDTLPDNEKIVAPY
ncbi:MAG: response regulator transcription factor [Caldilineaceae bacterium]|nr:response regulator transcription factor [Caldilineaceae bacterium]